VPGISEGGSSGAVDLDSKLGMGGGLSGRSGTGCSDDGSTLGMYGGDTSDSSSGSPCKTGLVSFWSLGFIAWATKTALSLFLGAESVPREHGLSHLKPGVNIGEWIGAPGGSIMTRQMVLTVNKSRVPSGGQLTPKVGHCNSHSVHSLPGDILIP
jgi:hypothetical protein